MNQSETLQIEEITNELEKKLKLENTNDEPEEEEDNEGEEEEDDDDEFEFEFFVHGEMSSPISAEEVFHNGQIRPIFPLSSDIQTEETTSSYDPPVRKVYVVSSSESGNDVMLSSEKLPEMSRKSNSTGFSRLRRVRDLLIRSNSDGKDAFVYLTGKDEKVDTKEKKKGDKISSFKLSRDNNNFELSNNLLSSDKKEKKKEKKSTYEVLYGKSEKKGAKSYLPYRQELVGFFTSANGMSRNIHPY